MPSGSGYRGGGGSHFGGSSGSSFGESYGRSGTSNRYIGPRVPGRFPIQYVYYSRRGRRYAFNASNSGWYGVLRILKVLVIILSCFPAIFLFQFFENLSLIKDDYSRYQNMIKLAEAEREAGNDNYFVDAIVESVEQNGSSDRYYINYYFYSESNELVKGYTFSVYYHNEIKDISAGDSIQIAVDSYPLTTKTDSIDLHYKNTKLSDDIEYQRTKKGMGMVAILLLINASFLGLFIFLSHKTKIKHSEELLPNGDLPGEPTYKYICTYCRGNLRESDLNCPHCGASTSQLRASNGDARG